MVCDRSKRNGRGCGGLAGDWKTCDGPTAGMLLPSHWRALFAVCGGNSQNMIV